MKILTNDGMKLEISDTIGKIIIKIGDHFTTGYLDGNVLHSDDGALNLDIDFIPGVYQEVVNAKHVGWIDDDFDDYSALKRLILVLSVLAVGQIVWLIIKSIY